MKNIKNLALLVSMLMIVGCVVHKRLYRKGFYVEKISSKSIESLQESKCMLGNKYSSDKVKLVQMNTPLISSNVYIQNNKNVFLFNSSCQEKNNLFNKTYSDFKKETTRMNLIINKKYGKNTVNILSFLNKNKDSMSIYDKIGLYISVSMAVLAVLQVPFLFSIMFETFHNILFFPFLVALNNFAAWTLLGLF